MSVTVIADPGACWRIPGEPWETSWRRMVDLMDIVRDAGAQVFKPQLLRAGMYADGSKGAALVSQYEVPAEWLTRLKEACDERDLEFMIAAYRAEDLPLIDPYVKRHKVASFDNTNPSLLAAIGKTGKPVLLSTGATQEPRGPSEAWRILGHYDITLLHCVSAYPAPAHTLNLDVLVESNFFGDWDGKVGRNGHAMGLSDHSLGNTAAVMAVALGATVIEKHVRHDETPPENPDYAAAASPAEFREYVHAIREAELMLGDGVKRIMPGEWVHYKYDPATGRRGSD